MSSLGVGICKQLEKPTSRPSSRVWQMCGKTSKDSSVGRNE